MSGGAGTDTLDLRVLYSVLADYQRGNFTVRMPDDRTGLAGKICDALNTTIERNERLVKELERLSTVVGKAGNVKQRAQLPSAEGAWSTAVESVNTLVSDLVQPTTEVARVIGAVAKGDLTQTMSLEIDDRPLTGEFLRTAKVVNTMVAQLGTFSSEVTRVAREVGTEGKLGGQAVVKGVAGTWKDLTDNVNLMAANLTSQVRNIAEVTTAVAKGDLSKKVTVDVKGEILELKNTVNTMVDQLSSFAAEVTRVAKEVGTEGQLGGQADVRGVAGTWKDLTDNVNELASNLTVQLRDVSKVATAIASGDLNQKITVQAQGEILQVKNVLNTMVDQLGSFASEVTRVAKEVGTEGKLGGQADVRGVAGTWKDLTDNVNAMAGNLTSQVRNIAEVTTAVAKGDLSKKVTVDVKGEILELKNTVNTMVDQLQLVRIGSDARREGSRHRRAAGRPGRRARRRRHVEGPHRQRQRARRQPDGAAARRVEGRDRDRQRRPQSEDHRAGARRNSADQERHQHDGGPAERVRVGSDARREGSRHRRQAGRPGGSAAASPARGKTSPTTSTRWPAT